MPFLRSGVSNSQVSAVGIRLGGCIRQALRQRQIVEGLLTAEHVVVLTASLRLRALHNLALREVKTHRLLVVLQ